MAAREKIFVKFLKIFVIESQGQRFFDSLSPRFLLRKNLLSTENVNAFCRLCGPPSAGKVVNV